MSNADTLAETRPQTALPPETIGGPDGQVREAETVHHDRGWNHHPIDIRVSVPLPFRRYYVTLVAGPERRSPERRKVERKRRPPISFRNILFLVIFGTLCGLGSATLVLNGLTSAFMR